jgi:hypothetical protein
MKNNFTPTDLCHCCHLFASMPKDGNADLCLGESYFIGWLSDFSTQLWLSDFSTQLLKGEGE